MRFPRNEALTVQQGGTRALPSSFPRRRESRLADRAARAMPVASLDPRLHGDDDLYGREARA
jgi:hypothetical protein